MEEGGAMGVVDGVSGTFVGAERRLGSDTGVKQRGARGVPNEEIRDLLLTVSQRVSHITGALQRVVAVLQKKDSEIGHVEAERNQTHAYSAGSIPRGTREDLPWEHVTDQTWHTEQGDADEGWILGPGHRDYLGPEWSSSSRERDSAERSRYSQNHANEWSHGRTMHTLGGMDYDVYNRDIYTYYQFQHELQNRAFQMTETGQPEAHAEDFRYIQHGTEGMRRSRWVNIAPFNGREEWRVWIKRFVFIANRLKWSKEDMLDNLIPRIEGSAAEFVFSQLPKHILHDYDLLVGELNNRYRRIETPQTFAAKFSSRNQKSGETAEEYAADLKCLYDKAHIYRDATTRQEDLVRRFLDGLWDDEARFNVDFHKEPATIDEAVYFVVCFMVTKRRRNEKLGERQMGPSREARHAEEEEAHGNSESVGRVPIKPEPETKLKDAHNDETQDILKLILDKLDMLGHAGQDQESGRKTEKFVKTDVNCFKCEESGHYARDCPKSAGDLTQRRGDNYFCTEGQVLEIDHTAIEITDQHNDEKPCFKGGWQEQARKVTTEHGVSMPDILETYKDAHLSRETWVKCQCSEEAAQATYSVVINCDLEHGRSGEHTVDDLFSTADSAGGPEITSSLGNRDFLQSMQQKGNETAELLMGQKDAEAVTRCLTELEDTGVAMKTQHLRWPANRIRVSNMEPVTVLQTDRSQRIVDTDTLKSTRCKLPRWLTKVKMRQKF